MKRTARNRSRLGMPGGRGQGAEGPREERAQGRLTRRAIWSLIGVGVLLGGGAAVAQDDSNLPRDIAPAPLSESAPPTPEDPTLARLNATVDAARQEFRDLEAEIAGEAEKKGEAIAGEQAAVTALRDEERKLRERLDELDTEGRKLEEQSTVAQELQSLQDSFEALTGEVESQALDVKERFEGTLFTAEYPDVLETIGAIGPGSSQEIERRVEGLLRVFDTIMTKGQEVGVFRTPVRLSGTKGTVKPVDVLRLGLLGGYYRDSASGEAGFVLTDEENAGSFMGESGGISSGQQAEISALIEDPAAGGFLPLDVTGGGGIASLRSRTTLAKWFGAGGVFMYPLLAVALAALLLVIERGIVLAIKSAGLRWKIAKVMSLLEDGNVDEAERLCRRWGGAVGNVLNAALVHRDQGRAVMEDAVQEALLHHAPSFHTRLSFIALCAAVAPLMGLLGTVTGMITTFKMVTIFGTSDPRYMAGGISEALITTQAGLYIAIPSLLMRGILGAAADRAVGKLEAGALSVVRAVLGFQDDFEESAPELAGAALSDNGGESDATMKARASSGGDELSLGDDL